MKAKKQIIAGKRHMHKRNSHIFRKWMTDLVSERWHTGQQDADLPVEDLGYTSRCHGMTYL